jgi:hypothetical protein
MAARYGATIVPFAGVGAEEGFQMLLDPQEIRGLPLLGDMIAQRSRSTVPQARRCAFFPYHCWFFGALHAGAMCCAYTTCLAFTALPKWTGRGSGLLRCPVCFSVCVNRLHL